MEVELQKRCDRNRKRSKRRSIYCPVHACGLDSVSPKYTLFADKASQLQTRGVSKLNALRLMASQTAVPLQGEWLEGFWCNECQTNQWYHVRKVGSIYNLSVAPPELWQQANGVINPHGNPSVGEFTRRNSRMLGFNGVKDFGFVR